MIKDFERKKLSINIWDYGKKEFGINIEVQSERNPNVMKFAGGRDITGKAELKRVVSNILYLFHKGKIKPIPVLRRKK